MAATIVCVTQGLLGMGPSVMVSVKCTLCTTVSNHFTTCISDINECLLKLDMCSSNATCINTEGGYNCSCNAGYHGDGTVCNSKIFS